VRILSSCVKTIEKRKYMGTSWRTWHVPLKSGVFNFYLPRTKDKRDACLETERRGICNSWYTSVSNEVRVTASWVQDVDPVAETCDPELILNKILIKGLLKKGYDRQERIWKIVHHREAQVLRQEDWIYGK
jgi:hypothetical protein